MVLVCGLASFPGSLPAHGDECIFHCRMQGGGGGGGGGLGTRLCMTRTAMSVSDV